MKFILSCFAFVFVISGSAHAADYENLGRVIGQEAGRSVGGSGYSSEARIGSLLGQTLLGGLAKPIDEKAKEDQRLADIDRRAKEKAAQDAAYEQARISNIERQARDQAARDAAYAAERARLSPAVEVTAPAAVANPAAPSVTQKVKARAKGAAKKVKKLVEMPVAVAPL